MQPLRAHRRTITAALAALALVVQALLPHVHAWQSGDHGAGFASSEHRGRVAVGAHDADHERAACPTCQALAQSRQLAPAPRPLALAYVALRVGTPLLTASPAVALDRAAPAAPRAPPVSA